MVEEWRLIDSGSNDAFLNMGLDEAIAVARSKKIVPNTIRFFRWNPSAVSIGYFQSMKEEVDTEMCHKKGVDYVRRITGGGAVYHDKDGELTYSMAINDGHRLVESDIQKTYQTICSGIIEGLQRLGIPAEFKAINDIEVDGKKISGNAQTRRWGVMHQHGTILIEVDPSLMYSLLRVPDEKIRDKQISATQERVTSINKYLGRKVSLDEMKMAFKAGCEKTFKIELTESKPIRFEVRLAEKLKREKYSRRDWNFRR